MNGNESITKFGVTGSVFNVVCVPGDHVWGKAMFDHTCSNSLSGYVVKGTLDIKKYSKGERAVCNGFFYFIDNPGQGNVAGVVLSEGMLVIMQWEVPETCLIGLPEHELFQGFEQKWSEGNWSICPGILVIRFARFGYEYGLGCTPVGWGISNAKACCINVSNVLDSWKREVL